MWDNQTRLCSCQKSQIMGLFCSLVVLSFQIANVSACVCENVIQAKCIRSEVKGCVVLEPSLRSVGVFSGGGAANA